MDKQTLSPNTNHHHHHHHHHHQDSHPSLLPPSSTGAATIKEDSPRKPPHGGGSGGNDRLKRDEWSEGAVSCLLEAYESKWILRNRAKLKGQDWDDVARHVSARANNAKSPKTQTQCKNKIESMKKRYRSESAAAGADGHGSSWVLYPRLDLLLRGNSVVSTQQQPAAAAAAAAAAAVSHHQLPNQQLQQAGNSTSNSALVLLETSTAPPAAPPPPPPPPVMAGTAQNSNGSNGFDHRGMPKEDGVGTKLSDHVSDKKAIIDTDSSTPALYSEKHDKLRSKSTTFMKMKNIDQKRKSRRKGREEYWEIAESIRWMAEVVVRSEQARMDTMREIEKMRVEAEAKRGELDLKRTEIIANTQLEIAKLFAASGGGGGGGGSGNGKNVDHSLRIGRN